MASIVISDFYCTECGGKGICIPRKNGQQRKSGHLKKLFCLKCQKEVNFCEIKTVGSYMYEDFLLEFKNGNFKDGQRIVPYGQFKNEYYSKQRGE